MKQEDRVSTSRKRILEAAISEFGAKGYKEASTNEICESSNSSKGLVFYYFKSKEALFNECADVCIHELDCFMKEHFEKGGTPLDGIRGCCLLRKRFFMENPGYYRILCEVLYERDCINSQNKETLLEKYKKHSYDIISRILEDIPLNPKIKRDEGIRCAVMMIEAIDIEIWNRYPINQAKQMLEEQMEKYEEFLKILIYGIL